MDWPDETVVPSGIVKSWIYVRLFVQVGVGVGVGIRIVGTVVGTAVTTGAVTGLVCGSSVGGIKNVGVEDGAQALRIKTKANNMACRLKLGERRVFITPKILLGRSILPPQYMQLFFGCRADRRFISAIGTHIERQGNFTAERFLTDHIFNFGQQFGILANIFLGIFASLTEAGIAI